MLRTVDRTGTPDSRRAWSVTAAAAIAIGMAFGTMYSFGAFFEAMADDFGTGRGPTALVFGVTLFLFFGSGVVTGPLCDRIGPRPLVFAGGFLMGVGLIATAQAGALSLGYLTYGVAVGIGGGLFVTPLFSTVGGWFVVRRTLAIGVAATGSGIGTLVLVPLSERLISAHGWRTAYVILGVIDLVVISAAGLVLAPSPVPPPPAAHERMKAVARTVSFQRMCVTAVIFSTSIAVAFAFVVDFATDEGIPRSRAALLVGLIGASSIGGRLGLTPFVTRHGALRVLQCALAAQPLAYGLWLVAGGNYALLLVFAVMLGVSYGAYVGISPEVLAVLFGVVGLGGVIGMLYLAAGVGSLIGPPMAGFLADGTSGRVAPIVVTVVLATVNAVVAFTVSPDPVDIDGVQGADGRPGAPVR